MSRPQGVDKSKSVNVSTPSTKKTEEKKQEFFTKDRVLVELSKDTSGSIIYARNVVDQMVGIEYTADKWDQIEASKTAIDKALRVIDDSLKELGLPVEKWGIQKVVHIFQLICGIKDGESGSIIGKKTILKLNAAINSKRSGKNWMADVEGLPQQPKFLPAAHAIDQNSGSFMVKDMSDRSTGKPGLIAAMKALGIISPDENNVSDKTLQKAVYLFQVIANVPGYDNFDGTMVGANTWKALQIALTSADNKKNWVRDASKY